MTASHSLPLLVFAHRGEASAFFEKHRLARARIGLPMELYTSPDGFDLLITGEGRQAATTSLSVCLTANAERYSRVINLGVCAGLRNGFEVGQTYAIRTCYGERQKGAMEFHSFTTGDEIAGVDCVSVLERLSAKEQTEFVEYFAPLADREAWAVAAVAKSFHLNFLALKCVSDIVGETRTCEDVRAEANRYAEALYTFYLTTYNITKNGDQNTGLSLPAGFHATVSQQQRLSKLVDKLSIRHELNTNELSFVVGNELINELLNDLSLNPKQRTRRLIEVLEERLNPSSVRIRRRLTSLLAPINRHGIEAKLDPDWEDGRVRLQAVLSSSEDFDSLRNGLLTFSYEDLRRVLDGELDHV